MIYAYDEFYLDQVMNNIGNMLDYVVYDLKINPDTFFKMFLDSGAARKIELGFIPYLSGKSGVEMAIDILEDSNYNVALLEPREKDDYSDMFWAGWVLAYYQWYRNISFEKIWESIPIYSIRAMYYPFHEADITKAVDIMDSMMKKKEKIDIRFIRRIRGMTQAELAHAANMSISQIQRLEYGNRKTDNLTLKTALSLAAALNVDVEELI
ncbi:MAG: helix-turn-helix transcriptional regulator [Erysipelotrichaceae bacterium]|nr:helix-turn-helix transcriptional regulator [Erysipelotrichaceae bacterium]